MTTRIVTGEIGLCLEQSPVVDRLYRRVLHVALGVPADSTDVTWAAEVETEPAYVGDKHTEPCPGSLVVHAWWITGLSVGSGTEQHKFDVDREGALQNLLSVWLSHSVDMDEVIREETGPA